MTRRLFPVAIAALAILAMGSTPTRATLLFHDDFEAGNVGEVPGTTALVGTWTIQRNQSSAWQLFDAPQGTAPNNNTTQFARAGRSSLVGRSETLANLTDPDATTSNIVEVAFDFYLSSDASPLNIIGSSTTGALSADRSFDMRLVGGASLAGTSVEGWQAGQLRLRVTNEGETTDFIANNAFTINAWHSLLLTANFATRSVDVSIDGMQVASGQSFIGLSDTLGAVYFAGFSVSSADLAYIDNVRVSSVPEPAAVALMGLGGLLISVRRRAAGSD